MIGPGRRPIRGGDALPKPVDCEIGRSAALAAAGSFSFDQLGYSRLLPAITGFLPGFPRFSWILTSFTGFYLVLPGFT